MKPRFLFVLLTALPFFLQAQLPRFSLEISGGLNYSDLNYGYELFDFESILPKDDYLLFSEGGQPDWGAQYGIGVNFRVLNRMTAFAGAHYSSLSYRIEASVDNLNPNVTRAPSPEIPVGVDGLVNYNFADLHAGLNYHFFRKPENGLYASLSLSHLIHLRTLPVLGVTYEDMSTGTEEDLPAIAEPDYKGLWFAGLGLGYRIPAATRLWVTPFAEFRYGLNPLIEEELNPTMAVMGARLSVGF